MPRLAWPIGLLVLVGCAAPPSEKEVAVKAPTMATIAQVDFSTKTDIALINNEGTKLSVGDDVERAQDLFPKTGGAKGFADLPPTLDATAFDAWGWQSKRGEAFGMIFDRRARKVAVAMRTMNDQGLTAVEDLVQRYQFEVVRTSPKQTLGVDAVRYWFWDASRGAHRLMICAVTNRRGGYTVTVAMGDAQVMDVIGANPEKATADLAKAAQVLEKRKNSPPGP